MSLPTSANLSLSQINSSLRFTNGNVGIGTTSPTTKLDINGTVNITGDFYQGGSVFGGGGAPSYTSTVTYSTSANLSITQPTDIIVSGQAGNVNLSLTSLTNGNYITVHNVGNTNGNYNNSSVFVTLGTSSTSGSIVRLGKGERTRIVARSTNTTIPYGYRQITTRSPVSKQISGWTERSIPNSRNWLRVVWAPELGLFCCINDNSAAVVMTSPDGITWTERSIPNTRSWRNMTWAPELGLFCVTAASAAFVMTSPDGITWTERSIPNARVWQSVTWAPELRLFCAVSNGSAFVMTSPDGVTWTERSIPNSRAWFSVVWAPELGLFCAVNANSAAFVMTSPDGITWTERAIPNTRSWVNLTWSPELGLFCAVCITQPFVMTSPDGITWTERSIPTGRTYRNISWAPELGLFCSIADGAAFVMTSPDGITWTDRSIPNSLSWQSITWSPELMTFCAVNSNSTAAVLTSFGLPLNIQPSPTSTTMGSTASLTTNTVSYTMSNFFTDTSGSGMYDYTLTSNPQSSGSLSAGVLSVTGNYRNTSYTVTVMGRNGINRTAGSSLTVNEANGAPIATSLGTSGTLTTNTVQYTLSSYFTNPAGVSGTITYSLVSNPQSSASISAGVLSVTGNNRNTTYTVTVRGTNSYGSSDSSLSVTEAAPPAPIASSMGSTGTLTNNTVQYTLSSYFTGTGLSYSLVSNPESSAIISGGVLSVTGDYRDTTYTVTVRATNAGGSADSSLNVTETYRQYVRTTNGWTPAGTASVSHRSICYNSGTNRLVMLGTGVACVMSSDNGLNWNVTASQIPSSGGSGNYRDMATNGTVFVAVSDLFSASNQGIISSTDINASSWTSRASGSRQYGCVGYSPSLGMFVALSYDRYTNRSSSSTAATWTLSSFGVIPSGNWVGITWSSSQSRFVAVGNASIISSTDGISWTTHTVPAIGVNWVDVASTSNSSVVVAVSPSNYIAYLTNGSTTWVSAALPNGAAPYAITAGNMPNGKSIFCVLRSDGSICTLRSSSRFPNSSNWINQGSTGDNNFSNKIAFNSSTNSFISPKDDFVNTTTKVVGRYTPSN